MMDEEKKEITENEIPVIENKTEEKEKKKQRRKDQKDKIEKKWTESIDYGGLTLELDFKGTIEVKLNNENTYTLTQEEYGHDCIGLRFHHSAPSFQIEAKDSTDLKYVKSNVYKF